MNFWDQSSTLTKVVIVALLLAVVCACAGVTGYFAFSFFSSESEGPVIGGEDDSSAIGGIIIVIPTPAPGVPSVTATANVNIRSGPSTDYPKVGVLQEGQTAEAIGVSPDGGWWVIKVPDAANGQGWVSGQYVTTANVENLPVVQPPPLPPATPAPPVIITGATMPTRLAMEMTRAPMDSWMPAMMSARRAPLEIREITSDSANTVQTLDIGTGSPSKRE
mgnify:CR=1 FL=1